MHKITVLALFAASFTLGAPADDQNGGLAKVIVASPSTTFEGKKIVDGATLGTLGLIKTGHDGGAKLKMIGNEVTVDISADSEVKLIRPIVGEPNEIVELISGMARAHVQPMKSATKERATRPAFTIRTKTVTMGARGTDFLGIVNPALDESEIIVFSGTVDFASLTHASDSKRVPSGYWGGIGGRFGTRIHELIKLPPAALEYFNKMSQDIAHYSIEKQPADKQSPPTNQSESSH